MAFRAFVSKIDFWAFMCLSGDGEGASGSDSGEVVAGGEGTNALDGGGFGDFSGPSTTSGFDPSSNPFGGFSPPELDQPEVDTSFDATIGPADRSVQATSDLGPGADIGQDNTDPGPAVPEGTQVLSTIVDGLEVSGFQTDDPDLDVNLSFRDSRFGSLVSLSVRSPITDEDLEEFGELARSVEEEALSANRALMTLKGIGRLFSAKIENEDLPEAVKDLFGIEDKKKGLVDNMGIRGPIVLDLDGLGIAITELSQSSVFVDADGDGLQNRTSWADAGNGILFYDPDGTGQLTEVRQYVFTEWDPTAASDIDALRSVFDTNGDGILDASDSRLDGLPGSMLDLFKVMVTQADGSLVAKSLSDPSIGIVSIDLTVDAAHIELPDGSIITGRTTYTKTDGSTAAVADATLVAETQSYRVDQADSTDGSGTRTQTSTAFNSDGSIAFVNTSVTTSNGNSIANSYDDNGDGVVDRLQTIITTTIGTDTVRTVTNMLGANAATAVLVSSEKTTTNASGTVVTIDRDSLGGGWYDQTEVRTTHLNGSFTIVVTDQGEDGIAYRSVTETVSADGLVRDEEIDRNGDGTADTLINHTIVVNPDGSRLETITTRNGDNSLRSRMIEDVSADGRSKIITRDLDGDGQIDTEEDLTITVNSNGTTSSDLVTKNDDGSVRSSVTQWQSDDALNKTIASDFDGDGNTDLTRVEDTTINTDTSRETVITETNNDGSVRFKEKVTLGADKVSSETWLDLNQDGIFQATDLVRDISVDATTLERTDISYLRSADGAVVSSTTAVTAADGLSSTTETDEDGDTNADTKVSSITVVNGNGSTTETVTVRNRDNTVRSIDVIDTTSDGLTITTRMDVDGDGNDDEVARTAWVTNTDDSVTTTNSSFAGDGLTLLSETVILESANRRSVSTTVDANGDGHTDQTEVRIQNLDGSETLTATTFSADGSLISSTEVISSADGLTTTTTEDFDGDANADLTVHAQTVLPNSGDKVTTTTLSNADLSLRSQSVETVRDDGFQVTLEEDANGDGDFERVSISTTTLNTNGSRTTIDEDRSDDDTLLSQARTIVSDDGLITSVETDADGDANFDLITTETTTLLSDGGTLVATETRDDVNALRSSSSLTTNDNGRSITAATDVNGDTVDDMVVETIIADDGITTETSSEYNADLSLQSRVQTETSATGLSRTVRTDADGDGVYEREDSSTTVLNANGSRTTTETGTGYDGTVHWRTITTISDDGLTTTVEDNPDGDLDIDLTMTSTLTINTDGSRVESVQDVAVDLSLLRSSTTTTSADRRSIVIDVDVDGNGHLDTTVETVIEDDGDTREGTSFFSSGGTLEATLTDTVSANGFKRTIETDHNADGIAEHVLAETGGIYSNGNSWRHVEHSTGRNVSLAREEYLTSDDGFYRLVRLDFDGDGLFDTSTDVETTFLANGDVVTEMATLDEAQSVIGSSTLTTSGNGLVSQLVIDIDGDGGMDRHVDTVRGASGGLTEVMREFAPGAQLNRSVTRTVSEDGWTTSSDIDLDGDGTLDQRIVEDIDDSRTILTTFEEFDAFGLVENVTTTSLSANGVTYSAATDVDADGTTDLTRSSTVSYDASGNVITTYRETLDNGQVIEEEITTDAANGFASTTTFDTDGDGVIDGTRTETVTLNDDGSRDYIAETRYSDGELRALSEISTSSDARHVFERYDVDGNGLFDRTVETFVRSDGETIVTERSFNEGGRKNSTFITTTSADGLKQTINRDGVLQTVTRSPIDNGSYTWDNGLGGTENIVVSHQIDGEGVNTWSYKTLTSDISVRLDQTSMDRVFAEAARIYDTVLDRDMDFVEREVLILFIQDGELDRAQLTSDLLNSAEFTTRYGTLSDSEFIAQMYLNTYGRAPGLTEFDKALDDLAGTEVSRADMAEYLAESVEHLVVGNGHMAHNNYDVFMNPAVYERSLDRAYVETLIKGMIDVAYDRAVTPFELEHYGELLMEGDDTLSDVAVAILASDGDQFGTATAPLKGLTGSAFIDQAFWNGLNRPPSASERTVWDNHITSGRMTQAEFVVSLSMSLDYLAIGAATHAMDPPLPNFQIDFTLDGNTLTGTDDQDELRGLHGNDTAYGGNSGDLLVGGVGEDRLEGQRGGDRYEWSKGDGDDDIKDNHSSAIETDRLVLTDVASSDVSLKRDASGIHLELTIVSTGEELFIHDQFFLSADYGLEEIEFSDGVVWTLADIEANTRFERTNGADNFYGGALRDHIFGLGGDDTLQGNDGDDTLVGGAGIDTLNGVRGEDTYVWETGDGNDLVSDTGDSLTEVDRLILTDVMASDISLTRALGSTTVELSVQSSGEKITLEHQAHQNVNVGFGIEAIQFGDGVIWSFDDIRAETRTNGTSSDEAVNGTIFEDNLYGLDGNDGLYGGNEDDVLVGGAGSDFLDGGHGSDRYLWASGDGSDTIDDTGNTLVETDRLEFTDVGSTNVSLTRANASRNLVISVAGTSETLTITEQYHPNSGRGLEALGFSDGVLWDRQDIFANAKTEGTSGIDNFQSPTNFQDNIYLYGGNDTAFGGLGDDVLVGGTGSDFLDGQGGSDLYFWSLGDGSDTIRDNSTSFAEVDTLRLLNVTVNQVSLAQSGQNLLISVLPTGEVITDQLRFHSHATSYGLEAIEFSDGTTVEVLAGPVAESIITGTSANNNLTGWGFTDSIFGLEGNDTLKGGTGDDSLFGGEGADYLEGNAGSDTYSWTRGDGNDTINDLGHLVSEADRLILTDVASTDVSLTRDSAGIHMDITVISSGEELLVQHQFWSPGYGLEAIEFSDGVVWGLDDIQAQTRTNGTAANETLDGSSFADNLYGLVGNDLLNGHEGDDQLVGGLGADTLDGGNGSDSYVWAIGDGSDRIQDGGISSTETDRLILTDVASTAVSLTRATGSIDVILAVSATGETLTLWQQYNHINRHGVEVIEFSDGVIWSLDDIFANTRLDGTNDVDNLTGTSLADNIFGLAGNDVIAGQDGDDTIFGGAGADTVNGVNGSDKYVWTTGDGNDLVQDTGISSTEVDRLHFTDVLAADVTLTRAQGSHNIAIAVGGTGSTLTVWEQYNPTFGYGLEAIEFSDGVIWSLDDIRSETRMNGSSSGERLDGTIFDDNIYGLGGNDTLYGHNGDDTLNGGSDADYLDGMHGSDSYVWSIGDGSDTIYDTGNSLAETDLLKLGDVVSTGVSLNRAAGSNDLEVTITATGDTLTITNQYHQSALGLEALQFSDGVFWSLDDIFSNAITEGTGASEILSGTGFADNLFGLAGNDTLYGGNGDDRLDVGTGSSGAWQYAYGGNGDDTYVFGQNSGDLQLQGAETSTSGMADRILFTDLGVADLSFTAYDDGNTSDGYGLEISWSIGGSSGKLHVDNMAEHIEKLDFGFGVVFDAVRITTPDGAWPYGTNGADLMFGNSGVDQLVGLAGDDMMYGGDGGDAFIGEAGDDQMYGGAGGDVFFFDGVDEGADVIHDLELGIDLVYFTGGHLVVSDVTFTDTDADGNGVTDALLSYDVNGISSSITVIDHDAATVQSQAIMIFA